MVIIWIGAVSFIIALCLGLWWLIFGKKGRPYPKLTKWMSFYLAVSIIIGLFWGLSFIESAKIRAEHQATYQELCLYKDLVANTTDECVRFDYYNKVMEWNDSYAQYIEDIQNPLFSAFHHNEFGNTKPLHFELRK